MTTRDRSPFYLDTDPVEPPLGGMPGRVTPADILAAQLLTGMDDPRRIERGRAYDPGTKRWYKDGFAPWQLISAIEDAYCGFCGYQTLTITAQSATCRNPDCGLGY